MDLFQTILECKEENVNSIIEIAIKEADTNAKKVEKLGFLEYGNLSSAFKGFIPLKTRIKYANINMEHYGMESTDFIYEFAHFIRKYNINNKLSLIHNLEYFINSYFGYTDKIDRATIFNEVAWKTSATDEEYFKALENNNLGDLKGKNAAKCTERGALAQQILSIFGTEVYYCMGCVDLESGQQAHCFNIVKRKNDYALLDYSISITSYNQDGSIKAFYPFIGYLTNEEFLDFINNGTIKSFDDYYINGDEKVKTNKQRTYVVGKYQFEIENKISNSK